MDQFSPSFEHTALEADIKQLAEEIRNLREKPETKSAGEREILKQAISVFPHVSSGTQSAPAKKDDAKSPLPTYAQNAPAEVKLEIEYLLDMAFHHGIGKALSEAHKSPFFVQDAFHDALAGRLYPELKRRGIAK
ncbi:MAG: hypothetical protein Q8P49_02815 [Candidatus Liptonbacteria bacterium]|nr:hypothetical protein [Candidatus Liptonbacteria bacterium]